MNQGALSGAPAGEQSGLQTHIATRESVSLFSSSGEFSGQHSPEDRFGCLIDLRERGRCPKMFFNNRAHCRYIDREFSSRATMKGGTRPKTGGKSSRYRSRVASNARLRSDDSATASPY